MLPERPVYIIDDEPEMCRSLSLLLSTDAIPARSFGCGELFLDTLDQLPPGILVCDVMMPGVSGIELTRMLAKRGRTDPVIMIAGHADIPLVVEAMRAGAIDFIEKPFEASKILSAIAAARCGSSVNPADPPADLPAEQPARPEPQVPGFASTSL